MLLKSPTRKVPEAPQTIATTTTQPVLPVPESAVTIPPLQSHLPGIPTPPPSIHGIDWQEGFLNQAAVVKGQDVVTLNVNRDYKARYVYALLVSTPANAANYYIRCEVAFWRGFSKIGFLPLVDAVSPAAASVIPAVLTSVFAGGGGVIDSSAIVFIPNPTATQASQYVVQPQYFEAEIDKITVSVTDLSNMTGALLWLGCKSVARIAGGS